MKYIVKLVLPTLFLSITIIFLFLSYCLNSNNIQKNYVDLILKDGIIQIEKKDSFLDDKDILKITKEIKNELIYQSEYGIVKENSKFANVYDLLNINNQYGDTYNIYYMYSSERVGIVEANTNFINENMIYGKMPSSMNEIMISDYIADLIIERGISKNGKKNYFESYEDIINSKIYFDSKEVTLVGILMYNLNEYETLKFKTSDKMNYYERKKHDILIQKSQFIYSKIYVSAEFIKNELTKLKTTELIYKVNSCGEAMEIINKFENSRAYNVVTPYTNDLNNMKYTTSILLKIFLFTGVLFFLFFFICVDKISKYKEKCFSYLFSLVISSLISYEVLKFIVPYIKSSVFNNGIYELLNPIDVNIKSYIVFILLIAGLIFLKEFIMIKKDKKTSF